tara:strand:+ start:273 stop:656 length:384 start_codon:yes stop_codon:yes gene_type:complete
MNRRITKTSIDESVSDHQEIVSLEENCPKVKRYLFLKGKERVKAKVLRGVLNNIVHVQGITKPKAIIRPSYEWNDNAKFVMTESLGTKNKFYLHGLLAKNFIGVKIYPTKPTSANFQVVRTYPKVQS